jgi:hexokinase
MHVALRGVVDSLYQHYPGFEERMREALRLLLGEEVEKLVVMGLAKDGSEVGGAHSSTFLRFCRPP